MSASPHQSSGEHSSRTSSYQHGVLGGRFLQEYREEFGGRQDFAQLVRWKSIYSSRFSYLLRFWIGVGTANYILRYVLALGLCEMHAVYAVQFHRGTYTSHGSIKKGNRHSEILLRDVEVSNVSWIKNSSFICPA